MLKEIAVELRSHAPFTLGGTVVGAGIMALMAHGGASRELSQGLFAVFHPAHVLLSAMVTAGIYRLHARGRWWATLVVGFTGAVAIGTLSDCLIPYLGEAVLGAAGEDIHAHAHIGFIELWWLVNPLAVAGAAVGFMWPRTKFPHAGHVLLSTAASLFHMTMSVGRSVSIGTLLILPVFLFLAVWVPCCTSDIVFPLLFIKGKRPAAAGDSGLGHHHDR